MASDEGFHVYSSIDLHKNMQRAAADFAQRLWCTWKFHANASHFHAASDANADITQGHSKRRAGSGIPSPAGGRTVPDR